MSGVPSLFITPRALFYLVTPLRGMDKIKNFCTKQQKKKNNSKPIIYFLKTICYLHVFAGPPYNADLNKIYQ